MYIIVQNEQKIILISNLYLNYYHIVFIHLFLNLIKIWNDMQKKKSLPLVS